MKSKGPCPYRNIPVDIFWQIGLTVGGELSPREEEKKLDLAKYLRNENRCLKKKETHDEAERMAYSHVSGFCRVCYGGEPDGRWKDRSEI